MRYLYDWPPVKYLWKWTNRTRLAEPPNSKIAKPGPDKKYPAKLWTFHPRYKYCHLMICLRIATKYVLGVRAGRWKVAAPVKGLLPFPIHQFVTRLCKLKMILTHSSGKIKSFWHLFPNPILPELTFNFESWGSEVSVIKLHRAHDYVGDVWRV